MSPSHLCSGSAYGAAPGGFPYESISVSYPPNHVRFDITGELEFSGGWVHDSEGLCDGPAVSKSQPNVDDYAVFDIP